MASLSHGSSSGTTTTTTTTTIKKSSSEEDLQQAMNDRKRKRMQSNRESARRSRMRKQKHVDDLTAQVSVLRRDNGQMMNALHLTTQQLVNVEAENSVLRAQIHELGTRLESLNQILKYMESYSDGVANHWCVNQNQNQNQNQAIMASADFHVFGY